MRLLKVIEPLGTLLLLAFLTVEPAATNAGDEPATARPAFQIAADDYFSSPSWSGDSGKLALLGWGGQVILIDVATQSLSSRFEVQAPVAQILLSPDASMLASYDARNLRIYATVTGQEIARSASPSNCIFYADQAGGAVWTDNEHISIACAIFRTPVPNDERVRALNIIRYIAPALQVVEEANAEPNKEAVSAHDVYVGESPSGVIVVRSLDLRKESRSAPRRMAIECVTVSRRERCFPDINVRPGAYFALPFLSANREATKVAIAVSDRIGAKAEAAVHLYDAVNTSKTVVMPPTAELSGDVLAAVAMNAEGNLIASSYLGSESKGTSGWLLWSAAGVLLQSTYDQRVHELAFSPDGAKLAAVGKDAVRFYQIEEVPADSR